MLFRYGAQDNQEYDSISIQRRISIDGGVVRTNKS